jgi:hypothetical protein
MLFQSALASHALKFTAGLDAIQIDGTPGRVFTRLFHLTLDKHEPRTQFKVHLEDWWRSADGKQSFYRAPGTLPTSCGPWTSINPVEAAVDPGAALNVRVSVAIPNDAKPGGYWCALTVDEVADPLRPAPPGVGVHFVTSVSVGIFVNVTPVHRAATITSIETTPEQAVVTIRNDGDCPLTVKGRFEFVRNGETVADATVPWRPQTLLPQPVKEGQFTAVFPDVKVLPPGKYVVRAIMDIGLDHYIGAQKELEIARATVPERTPPDPAK